MQLSEPGMRGQSIPELECQLKAQDPTGDRPKKKRSADAEKTSKRGTERLGKKWGGKRGQRDKGRPVTGVH